MASSQEFSLKFGNVTEEEIAMDSYIQDITANTLITFQKGEIICRYTLQNNREQLVINFILQFNNIIYPATDYPVLKTFREKLVEKNTEQIILKKKSI